MTDAQNSAATPQALKPTDWASDIMRRRIARRYRTERRFRAMGLAALIFAAGFLAFLLINIAGKGIPAFFTAEVRLPITFDAAVIGDAHDRDSLNHLEVRPLIKAALTARFPEASTREQRKRLNRLVSEGADRVVREALLANSGLIGKTIMMWLPASDDTQLFVKGKANVQARAEDRTLSDDAIAWLSALKAKGDLRETFDTRFFMVGDSTEPETAGIWGATKGSFLTLFVTLIAALPVAIFTAIYLEEFAPKNRWTDLVEVNINNLAAVPSIIYGLLGLAVFLGSFGMPRSAPLVGGLTLALMTMPTIVIAGRAAIKAVPPSIRDGAIALGASPLQAVFHHVLPSALPGILTGTIIGMSRALGETAPLLLIGMVAFVADIPRHLTDAATVLPVQVYLWSDATQRLFVSKTSAAILVLLSFLLLMNGTAIYLRNRFEKHW